MQVDNVSCKCLLFALRSSKKNPSCFCFLWRRLAVCPCLTDVLSSEPCSFPCAIGWIDADRAQKHGMDEFISANPCSFDHASLFEMVQRLTLDHRLNDTFCCLVSDSDTCVAAGCFFGLICSNVIPMCVFALCRDGLALARCLSWMSTVPGTECGVVTDICVTCVIYSKEQRVGLLLTPLFFTTASLFVPPMSMGTGVP